MKKCLIKSCFHLKRYSDGYCMMHHLRLYRYGRLERKERKWGMRKVRPILCMHMLRFGGLREEILVRDGYKCVLCGMTNEQHFATWGKNLTLNHIDHQGRYSNYQNNSLENLETLCLRCHGHVDALKTGKYSIYHPERSVN